MKLIELLNKIANGEIKEGTKFKFVKYPQVYEVGIDYFVFGTANLNDEVEIIEEKQQGRWGPKEEGTAYFSINDWGVIFQTHYNNAPKDWFRILNKNVFKTDSEAKEYLEYKTALLEAEKPFEYGIDNYYIYHEWDTEDTVLRFTNFEQVQGTVYLGNDFGIAEAFLDKWYKQILKYEFGIEE